MDSAIGRADSAIDHAVLVASDRSEAVLAVAQGAASAIGRPAATVVRMDYHDARASRANSEVRRAIGMKDVVDHLMAAVSTDRADHRPRIPASAEVVAGHRPDAFPLVPPGQAGAAHHVAHAAVRPEGTGHRDDGATIKGDEPRPVRERALAPLP